MASRRSVVQCVHPCSSYLLADPYRTLLVALIGDLSASRETGFGLTPKKTLTLCSRSQKADVGSVGGSPVFGSID